LKLYDTCNFKSIGLTFDSVFPLFNKEGKGVRGSEEMKFETYGNCFVCGEKNPNGLRLNFKIDKERQTLQTTFIASPTFQGWDGIVHGGIISTLLDEAMAKLVYELGYPAVTAALEVRFKNPAPILQSLSIHGEIVEVKKRLIKAKSRVVKEDGTLLAEGKSTFIRQSDG
jgi:uncharacterized protein (TIGR00369 family)